MPRSATLSSSFGLGGTQSAVGLSPAIWKDVDIRGLYDPGYGTFVFDDFLGVNIGGTDAYITPSGSYKISGTGTQVVASVASEIGATANDNARGIIRLTTGGTADDDIIMTWGDTIASLGAISDATTGACEMSFECRVRFESVTDAQVSSFIGLVEPTNATGDEIITDAHALGATVDLIGFVQYDSDGNNLQSVYQATGQALQVVSATAVVPTAATWMKLGITFDPTATDSKHIKFWKDGVELTDGVDMSTGWAATFPEDVQLTMVATCKTDEAAAHYIDLDWWAFSQVAKL
jgi:hypothetical protein